MSKDQKPKTPSTPSGGTNVGGVVTMTLCPVEKCGKRATRSEFCDEHFVWFKEGLIARDGSKPKDFDKKYQAFLLRQKKAA